MKGSLVTSRRYALEEFFLDPVFAVTDITARRHFENGVATDQIDGYVYLVTNTSTFQQVTIFVPGSEPVIKPEQLAEIQESGNTIFAEFLGGIVRAYYNKRTEQIEDSIKAESVKIISDKEK